MPDVTPSPQIYCPRCKVTMQQQVAAPHRGAAWVRADVCERCASVWFDKAELEEVSPELAGLPERPDEVAALGAPSRGLPHCPRCHGAPVELLLLDVAIDFCPSCHGVWLDGGELEALARAQAAEAHERAKEVTKEGSYRESPRARGRALEATRAGARDRNQRRRRRRRPLERPGERALLHTLRRATLALRPRLKAWTR